MTVAAIILAAVAIHAQSHIAATKIASDQVPHGRARRLILAAGVRQSTPHGVGTVVDDVHALIVALGVGRNNRQGQQSKTKNG